MFATWIMAVSETVFKTGSRTGRPIGTPDSPPGALSVRRRGHQGRMPGRKTGKTKPRPEAGPMLP